jgi:opacity protein-like surface antigen
MRSRFFLAALLVGVAAPAAAADLPTLPSLAVDPQLSAPEDYWKGFYLGTGISASFAKGAKGQAGGDVFAGYDRSFSNGLVLGGQFDTGYNPWVVPGGHYQGFDFAQGSVSVRYEMGRFTPYVMAGVALAKQTNFVSSLPDANATINGLFSGPGAVQAVGVGGVGIDYAVTNNLHVGVGAYLGNGGVGVFPR